MRPWQDFYNHVVTHLKGATLPVISNEVRNAAIEFCERAPVWTVPFVPITVTLTDLDYPINIAEVDVVLVKAVDVWYIGTELVYKTPGELATIFNKWVAKSAVAPEFWTQMIFNRLWPVPSPNVVIADAITGLAQVKPTDDADGVPDEVFQQWYRGISSGALSRLFLMPNKPWTNGELGVFHAKAFDMAIDAAIMKVRGQ